jgi:hypothetical protein
MHVLDIPHFKEVIIMATNCQHCGYKSNEVKAGGAIAPLGKRIILNMTDKDDLSRDILKVRCWIGGQLSTVIIVLILFFLLLTSISLKPVVSAFPRSTLN